MKGTIYMTLIAAMAAMLTACGDNADKRLRDYLESYTDYDLIPVSGSFRTGRSYSGYANPQGERVIEWIEDGDNFFPRGIGPFLEGLAYVPGQGFIDKTGATVLEIDTGMGGEYESCEQTGFSEGVTMFLNTKARKETIGLDKEGNELFRVEGRPIGRMHAGYALLRDRHDNLFVIDKNGDIVWEPQDEEYMMSARSAAKPTTFTVYRNGKIAYIIDLKTQERYLEDFGEELGDYACPIIDWNGQVIIGPIDGKYGVVNLQGEWVIEPEYDDMRNDGSLYMVKQDNLIGWVDKQGKVVIEPQFEPAASWVYYNKFCFSFNGSELAYIHATDGSYFIDRQGKRIYEDVPGDAVSFRIGDRYLADIRNGIYWMTVPDFETSKPLDGYTKSVLPDPNYLY